MLKTVMTGVVWVVAWNLVSEIDSNSVVAQDEIPKRYAEVIAVEQTLAQEPSVENAKAYENALLEFLYNSSPPFEESPAFQERYAGVVVDLCSNAGSPSILTSLWSNVWQLPDSNNLMIYCPTAEFEEQFSRKLLARCIIDKKFSNDLVWLTLWTGLLVPEQCPERLMNQNVTVPITVGIIESNPIRNCKDHEFWRLALKTYVLARILGYNGKQPKFEKDSITSFSEDFVQWVFQHEFEIDNSLGTQTWKPKRRLESKKETWALPVIALPDVPMQSLLRCKYKFPRLLKFMLERCPEENRS